MADGYSLKGPVHLPVVVVVVGECVCGGTDALSEGPRSEPFVPESASQSPPLFLTDSK